VEPPAPPALTRSARVLRFPPSRILIALLAILVPFAAVAIPLNRYVADIALRRIGALLLAAIILAGYCAYVRIVEKRRPTELSPANAVEELGAGIAVGTLLLSLTIAVLAALGIYRISGSNGWVAMLGTIPGFVMGAVLEEVVFRGVLFRILEQWLGSWTALAITAAVFGLLHMLNPGATLLNAASIVIEAGVLLAAAYMLTRRLWFCFGIHFAWNFTQGGIFSVAVSGGAARGLLQAKLAGPVWLSGGPFGVEASVVAVAICTAAGLIVLVAAVRAHRIVPPSWSAS
jgi:membrane protease YdiL (CAAX protease family)